MGCCGSRETKYLRGAESNIGQFGTARSNAYIAQEQLVINLEEMAARHFSRANSDADVNGALTSLRQQHIGCQPLEVCHNGSGLVTVLCRYRTSRMQQNRPSKVQDETLRTDDLIMSGVHSESLKALADQWNTVAAKREALGSKQKEIEGRANKARTAMAEYDSAVDAVLKSKKEKVKDMRLEELRVSNAQGWELHREYSELLNTWEKQKKTEFKKGMMAFYTDRRVHITHSASPSQCSTLSTGSSGSRGQADLPDTSSHPVY